MKHWTILVFMAADNDLNNFAIRDLHEMELVGSTSDVDFVVQVDRYGDGDKGLALRGRIEKDPNWKPYDINFISNLQNIGETNTGDPEVLRDFIEWGVSSFPAENFALVIWNHGSGWKPDFIYKKAEDVAGARIATAMRNIDFASRYQDRLKRILFRKTAEQVVAEFINKSIAKIVSHAGFELLQNLATTAESDAIDVEDELEKILVRAIALDETSNRDALDCLELKTALARAIASISSKTGIPFKLGILGFDACLMAGLEIAYQVRDIASYIVGSEEIEPAIGWRYDLILQSLVAVNGQLSPRELGQAIVSSYTLGMQNYKIRLVTQSCIDTTEIKAIAASLNELGALLLEMINTDYQLIAKSEKQGTRFYDTDFLDIGDFVSLLKITKIDKRLDGLVEVMKRGLVASEFLFPRGRQSPNGLSVYFPTKPLYDDAYTMLDLSTAAPAWPLAIKSYHFL